MATLLPSGFPDARGKKAAAIFEAGYKLTRFFMERGYELYAPPLLEFADSYAGDGASMRDMFRMTDPETRETLVLRGDMTQQILRMAEAELRRDDAKLPLRVSYVGKGVRTKAEDFAGLRERTQAGAECIGAPPEEALEEILALTLENVLALQPRDMTIILSLPSLIKKLEENIAATLEEKTEFRRAMAYKDYDYARERLGDVVDSEWLLGIGGDRPEHPLPEALQGYVDTALHAITALKRRFPNVGARLDPADVRLFPYHKDVAFSILCQHSGRELGRGGHYAVASQDAVGATLYLEDFCSEII